MAYIFDEAFFWREVRRSELPATKLEIKLRVPESDKDTYEHLLELRKDMKSFVRAGNNLLIWSYQPGTGKTLLATHMAMSYIKQRNELNRALNCALFVNLADLLFLRKDYNNIESQLRIRDLEQKIFTYDLVVWDDIGTKDMSDHDKDYLIMLLNKRLNSKGKSNIYTTNLDRDQLYEALGGRLCSRLYENTEVIELKGGDHR